MITTRHTNITRIKAVAGLLKALQKEVVFVGGATVSLYAGAAAAEARPTDDVDVLIELASYNDYAALDEQLRKAGFENDVDSGVICRYRVQGIIVDIMPTQPEIIGFSNRWYPDGFSNAVTVPAGDMEIKIFSLPYFIAAKLEAFKGRGNKDYRFSSDFEDIVYILENGPDAEAELLKAPKAVRQYLIKEFAVLLKDKGLAEGLYAHLEPATAPQQIIKIEELFKKITSHRR